MEENNFHNEEVKKKFAQAETILSRKGRNNFENTEIRNAAWLKLQENENYYKRNFIKRMYEYGVENPKQAGENEFYDCFVDIIYEVINKFSPEKGGLESYFNYIWRRRVITKAEEINKRCNIVSLDAEKEDDDGNTIESRVPVESNSSDDSDWVEVEPDSNITEVLMEILNAITHMKEHCSGKTDRKQYFRMFFTDYITEYCKNFEIGRTMKNKEKSIFSGLHTDFLDFYMRYCCRTLKEIQRIPLKSMREINGKGSENEIKLPLPNQVYIIYLGLSSSGNVTQMKKKYKIFCEEIGIRSKLE